MLGFSSISGAPISGYTDQVSEAGAASGADLTGTSSIAGGAATGAAAGTATGATITGASTIAGGVATGVAAGFAPGATLTGTAHISAGSASVEADANNHIRYALVTHDREQHVNLVNLRYALFSQLSPASFTAPVVKGTIAQIVGPAELNIPVSAAVAPAGWYMLILSDADNTTTVAVPVLVS
jgi:hypothetical protein